MNTAQLGLRIRQLRRERGWSQEQLARSAGLSRNFVAQIERGESTPTVATLGRLAQALATTIAELLGQDVATPAGELVAVPLVSDTIAAGPPAFLTDHVERMETLPRTLLHALGVDPRHAALVRLGADQDSMADTIPPGSTVLVDRAPVRRVVPRAIYAVREEVGGEVGCTVKRLVLDGAARVLILLSDNPAHLPRAVRLRSGEALSSTIIGRVVWWLPPAPPGP
jgi:transcriptional regulator with XRE-family HTH domain